MAAWVKHTLVSKKNEKEKIYILRSIKKKTKERPRALCEFT